MGVWWLKWSDGEAWGSAGAVSVIHRKRLPASLLVPLGRILNR